MQFVRAPDENVYIAPFNLIELVFLALPFEWWVSKHTFERLNDIAMFIIYSPLLLVAAYFETRMAADIVANRCRGDEDDDTVEEWEQMASEVDFVADGWQEKVQRAKSNVEEEPAVLEVRSLREELRKTQGLLNAMGGLLQTLVKEKGIQAEPLPLLEPLDAGNDGKGPDRDGASSSNVDLLG